MLARNDLTEAARIYANLRYLDDQIRIAGTLEFWNVALAASGDLESHTSCRLSGSLIWRLCPSHQYCIGLLVVLDDQLLGLDVCARIDIAATEQRERQHC